MILSDDDFALDTDQGIDVESFFSNDPEDEADEAYAPGLKSTSKLALDACSTNA